MDGGIIGNNIQKHVIDAKEEHKWTPQEIDHQKKLSLRWNLSNAPLETLQPLQESLQESLQEAPQQAPSVQAPSTQAPSPQAPQKAPSIQAPSRQQARQESPRQPPQEIKH